MKQFEYVRPSTIPEAVAAAGEPGAAYLASGTNLLDLMKGGAVRPDRLVDVTHLPGLDRIEPLPDGGMRIGALVRNADLARDPEFARAYPAVAEALLSGASAQLRNAATVGGNLMQRTRCGYFHDAASACNRREPGSGCDALHGENRLHAVLGWTPSCIATHPSDFCVPLVALDAIVEIEGSAGRRELALEDLHLLPGETPEHESALEPGELIVALRLPPDAADFARHARYLKLRDRTSYAFAVVSAAAALVVGALIGGASGAGIAALVSANQTTSIPAADAEGAQSIVVNDASDVNQITAVAATASPSVVTISVSGGSSAGTGSGVILSEDGYILTNTHVVTLDGATGDPTIEVKTDDGRLYTATLIGTDPLSDLAVIKLDDASDMTPIEFADSDALNVGDVAIAIGAPLGLSGTVTNGIVSALNRSIDVASSAAPETPDDSTESDEGDGSTDSPFDFWNFEDQEPGQGGQSASATISLPVIQTDAAINPGNSGGALLNSDGELIGINVAILSTGSSSSEAGNIGVGFAVPSNLAMRIADEIIEDGSASHGLLGATVSAASAADGADTVGALIQEVTPGGGADQAGLQSGDIVTNFNGVPITDQTDLTAQVRALPGGAQTDLTYVRDGQSTTVTVTLSELPTE